MAEEQQRECRGVCLAHSRHEERLDVLTESLKIIKRMFWAIIFLLVTSIIRPNIATFLDTHTASTQAQERVEETVE